jgi:hypothetical protein
LLRGLLSALGWLLGWACFWAVRLGSGHRAEGLIDAAIMMRRHNPGAIRAILQMNGRDGMPAHRRGRLLVTGRMHDSGPFANNGFYATYDVAAPTEARALALIRRFEWDALPQSLQIEEGTLDSPDWGAEGVLWVAPGRTFFTEIPVGSGGGS